MTGVVELRTQRLHLRHWRERDRAAFHALNSDPAVMATIGPVMSRAESDAFMNRIQQRFSEQPFGLWCVDLDGEPIGFTGLSVPWFRDGVEVGWRVRSQYWGHGYAPEAAKECLRYAFQELALDEVISFTAAINDKSRRVMDKIGLVRDDAADFEHPGVPVGSPLRPHVLYRIDLDRYRSLTWTTVLLLHGPNLNLLGEREPHIYGTETLDDYVAFTTAAAEKYGLTIESHQSNHEGELIDHIHAARGRCAAIIINPGAFTHYAWAIHDALAAFEGPKVEVHISNPNGREPWRHVSVVAPVATGSIMGFGKHGYDLAVQAVAAALER